MMTKTNDTMDMKHKDNFGIYIESFEVGPYSARISKVEGGTFRCWFGGGGVGPNYETQNEAREFIRSYIVTRAATECVELRKQMKQLEHILSKLGDDFFNLGQFKVLND